MIFGSGSNKITIDGLEDLGDALRNLLPPAKAAKVMRAVLTKRAQPIADRARQGAPVRTGQLRRSITVSNRLTRRQSIEHKKVDSGDAEVFVGAGKVPHASIEEYGTSRTAPHPFMRPAWDAERANILTGLGQDIWNELVQTLAKVKK